MALFVSKAWSKINTSFMDFNTEDKIYEFVSQTQAFHILILC